MTAVGRINLPTMVGGRMVMQYFSLLDCRAPYNAILGRDWIHAMEAVTSTVHQCLKFITPAGVMKQSQCFPTSYQGRGKEGPPTIEELVEVQIGDRKEQTTFIRAELPLGESEILITLLKNNKDVFAWSLRDIPGIDPDIACHRLNISEGFKPVRQKPRKMAPERKANVAEEIDRMLEARIIRPVKYPEWLENIVVVPKKNGKIRNAGATYQRLVDEMFKDMIGKTMEVYIDDMVVKSKKKESHLMDLKRTFDRLRQYGMKLNASKCSFGLTSGKFLGYMMTQIGIEANPEQIRAILEMSSPRNKKEIQRLTGRLAALNRFISWFSDKCKSFFLALKKVKKFDWNEECERAFNEIKQYLISPPVLTSPKTGQTVYIYLAASDYVVCAVLFVREPEERPVYFVSKSLTDAETRYSKIEKMALALMHAARRLKPYFEGRRLVVYTEYPLKKVLGRTDDSSRLATWDTYLGAYTIDYEPRTAEKGHAITSLMADFPVDDIPVSESILEEEILHDTETSNNQDEYEAVISGLKTAIHLGARKVKLITDSRLVENHYSGTYKSRNERLASYLEYIHELAKEFELFEIEKKPKLENRHADALAYVSAVVVSDTTRYIVVEFQELPSTHSTIDAARKVYAGENNSSSLEIPEDSMDTDEVDNIQPEDWRQPYIHFLKTQELPQDKNQAGKITRTARRYALIEGELYKKPMSMEPYLRCVTRELGKQLLAEAHEGCCGNHSGGRSLAHRLLFQGYFWPYMQNDAKEYTKRFGVPAMIVSDNGKQFDCESIKSLCEGLHIKHNFSTPYYAQSNEQAEATDRVILDNLKKTLDKAKGRWT
ncbi:uncharacterized protein LOC113278750 [Papaver somniferum]|uniref:uncharacterized protein LOC113278750 n=1 Tax=Papaver somniferum TaxID=3469 RepID=UPI000E6FB16D|nr:uncharacterized protein LOC113278750 [Papaver somniferum]